MQYFIIDFDSTFITSESLEEYAAIILNKRKDKNEILEKIKKITKEGMEGKISFESSLSLRMKLLSGTKKDVKETIKRLSKQVSISIKRNKRFFKKFNNQIYVISGGFREFILPIVSEYGIEPNHILANSFVFDTKGNVIGYDKKNPLAKKNGKVNAVRSLQLIGDIYVIGDGYTDYQILEMGAAKHFVAFTENIKREIVIQKAETAVGSFDEFLYINRLPMSLSYPKSKINVVLFEHIDKTAVDLFKQEGYGIDYIEKPLSDRVFFNKIQQASIIGIRSRTQVNKELLEYPDKLMTIGAYCIGTNQLDLSACSDKGIPVFNAPYSNTRSVVEMIIAEIIMLERGIPDKNLKLHNGVWDKSAKDSHEIRGKKLGIIGYGNIGSQLSVLAEALGMHVYFYDLADKLALGNAKKCNSMKELLRTCDIITVHVDGNENNVNLIDTSQFELMKQDVLFLNASRGFAVNIRALTKFIRNGKIKAAAIDVFPYEPKNKSEPFVSDLQKFPNVILTPHIGGSTEEAQKNIAEYVTLKIIGYVNSGQTGMSVNFPEINQPKPKNSHRLLHIHQNLPGILAQINAILAKNHMNVEGQYLKTTEQIGYVITDVNKKYDANVLRELKQIPNTIRFRVLY